MKTLKIVNHRIIDVIKSLRLSSGDYAVSGSALLEIFGVRESGDIDLVVTRELFDKYRNIKNWALYIKHSCEFLGNNKLNVEMNYQFDGNWSYKETQDLIKNGIKFDDVNFINFDDTIRWKQGVGRKKDLEHIVQLERLKEKHEREC